MPSIIIKQHVDGTTTYLGPFENDSAAWDWLVDGAIEAVHTSPNYGVMTNQAIYKIAQLQETEIAHSS